MSEQDRFGKTGVGAGQLASRLALTVLVFMLALFLPAGTLMWPAGWMFLLLFFGFTFGLTIWLLRFNPHLLVERLTGIGKPDHKSWDKVLLAVTAAIFFAWLAFIPVDTVRFRWSRVPWWVQELGALLLLCSFYLFYVTFRANPYLSPAVRIQKERAHSVISSGPYRYVRHPMYTGFVLFAIGTPFLLGSWYGLLGTVLLIVLIGRRAVLEERALHEELTGYSEYMVRTRYRLVPFVW
ncbi:MAG: isoprenylcysteine carboxylmethyltransferase family protein [Acidobacteria bacterium]|nr:isoprenylcysteine carboxylmethyltransferase family protein [Acidobacteriota bacterium]MBV9624459.1 isoprenylcysteine carboxylmethyltransferase family protein [Acidobacteriota bacterium]